jgi:predicted nucleotidyltransferase
LKKPTKEICKEIVNEYKEDKNVLGIVLFGSVVRDTFDQYSDIDIYIFLKKRGVCSMLNFIKNNIRVDIIFNTVSEATSFLKEDAYCVRRNTSHMLAHSRTLYQAGNDLKKIIIKAKSNLKSRTKYTNDEILMHKYSIDDFWGEVQRDIKNKNYVAFGLDSQLLLNNIIELFLKLNGSYFRQPNEMYKTLKEIDRGFAKKITNLYKTSNAEMKKRILGELVVYIYKISHGPLPKKWAIK